jgi:ABC-type molybdenum transport system ATPase subunit/photorepair protein PhrA
MSLALRLSGVGLVRDEVTILDGVDLTVARHKRWMVLGPNTRGRPR